MKLPLGNLMVATRTAGMKIRLALSRGADGAEPKLGHQEIAS